MKERREKRSNRVKSDIVEVKKDIEKVKKDIEEMNKKDQMELNVLMNDDEILLTGLKLHIVQSDNESLL